MRFFTCRNNGVVAIVSEDVMFDFSKQQALRAVLVDGKTNAGERDRFNRALSSGTRHLGMPIFTFASAERRSGSPWFTDDFRVFELLREHLERRGDTIEEGSFFVPFSNGAEVGIHGEQAMTAELAYVTTHQQFRDAFGITLAELREVLMAKRNKK